MAGKRDKPEDVGLQLRQVEVLPGQGMAIADAVRQIGVTVQTFYRWRKQYGGMSRDQIKRLKELEAENQRLRRAVSDLTLDKMVLTEATRGNFCALRGVVSASIMCGRPLAYPSAGLAAHSGSIGRHNARLHAAQRTKDG
jgi:hypothetical protein